MNKAINLQDVFLNQCRKGKISVTIILTNGFQFKGLVRGEYGKTPLPISEEIKKKIIGDEKQITCRPADNIKPELERLKSEIAEYIEQDEDVLSYALFDQVAVKYIEHRKANKYQLSQNTDYENKVTSV